MTKLLAWLVMLTLGATIVTPEVLFDRVPPIIWLKSDKVLTEGTVEFNINFAYTHPCKVFEKNVRAGLLPDQKLAIDDEVKLTAFEKNCMSLYILEWEQEVRQLLEVKLPNKQADLHIKPLGPYKETINKRERRNATTEDGPREQDDEGTHACYLSEFDEIMIPRLHTIE